MSNVTRKSTVHTDKIQYYLEVNRITVLNLGQQILLPLKHSHSIFYILVHFRMFVFKKILKRDFHIVHHDSGGI